MIQIKQGEPQPLACKKCKAKLGYTVTHLFEAKDCDYYDGVGNYITTNSIDTIFKKTLTDVKCQDCDSKLNFRIIAEEE